MITLFTAPRAFRGPIGIIQRNAIQSWLLLGPKVEIILFGDEEGTAEVAREFGVRHIPEVDRNEFGTPLVDGLFRAAEAACRSPLLGYVNADILFLPDFMLAVEKLRRRPCFLLIGQRWDVDLPVAWDFTRPDWEARMRALVAAEGKLHPPTGVDFFVYRHGFWKEIPAFALGRTVWDNWLIYGARTRGAAVVDATSVVTAVHQNHLYDHSPTGADGIWNGPEAKHNLELAGGGAHVFTVQDATHLLTHRGVHLALAGGRLRRHWDTLPILHPRLRWFGAPVRGAFRLVRRVLP